VLRDKAALQAHLASLLRLENVGMLLGAGASIPAGGKAVASVWAAFLEASPASVEWLHEQSLITDEEARDHEGVTPDVEALIDKLGIALSEWQRIDDEKLAVGTAVRAELYRAIVRAAILDSDWWAGSSGDPSNAPGLQNHRQLLQKITASRQPGQAAPWFFTTNYDLAIEWAAESIDMSVMNGFLGIHNRRFSPQSFDLGFRNTQARGEARFGVYNIYLAKLHGSLTWLENNSHIFELPASQAWPQITKFLERETDDLGLMVLPSAAKYFQTTGFLLGELLRRLSEFLSRPQTCLIISGYGFGDQHVNRLLYSALLNPTLQLVIYLPEFNGDKTKQELPHAVRNILDLQSPRVTVVGGGEEAHLDELVRHLPDPALYDDGLATLEGRIREPESNDSGVDQGRPQ